jgi:hypothetical protein
MSCPKCFCPECSAERAKWFAPLGPQFPAFPEIGAIQCAVPPGYWRCSRGLVHPPGYVCTWLGTTT